MVLLLERSKSLVLIALVFSLLASAAAFLLGSVKTVYTITAAVGAVAASLVTFSHFGGMD